MCREIAEAGPPLSQGTPRSGDADSETWLNRTMICGPTGTACNNLSDLGAETLDRCTAVYNTEFSDQQLKALCLVWRGKTRLLIDEFSMVGRVKLAKASHNLNKIFYKLAADEADDPLELTCDDMFPYGFGGLDVFWSGISDKLPLSKTPPLRMSRDALLHRTCLGTGATKVQNCSANSWIRTKALSVWRFACAVYIAIRT